jgi:hypothetical protein
MYHISTLRPAEQDELTLLNSGRDLAFSILLIEQSGWRRTMTDSEAYQSAQKRVEAKMGFYTHLTVYGAVILFLAIINLLTSSGTIWFHWPMLGWGVAVLIHALTVFIFPSRFAVTEKMIEKEMGKSTQS